MRTVRNPSRRLSSPTLTIVLALIALLAACGGGAGRSASDTSAPASEAEGTAQSSPPEAEAPETTDPQAPARPSSGSDGVAATPTSPDRPRDTAGTPASDPPPREAAFTMVSIPEGKGITVVLNDSLNSKTSRPGDGFTVTTKFDVQTRAHPEVIIPAGSTVTGEILEAQKAKELKGQAKLVMKFNELRLPSGKTVPLVASLGTEGKDTSKRSAGAIAGGAAAGAILGKIIGKDTKGAAIGAVAGAAIGTGVVVGLENKDVDLPEGTELVIRIDQPFDVPVPQGGA